MKKVLFGFMLVAASLSFISGEADACSAAASCGGGQSVSCTGNKSCKAGRDSRNILTVVCTNTDGTYTVAKCSPSISE